MPAGARGVVAAAVGALVAACGTAGGSGAAGEPGDGSGAARTRVEVVATVTYLPIEGGFWALRADDGTVYDPTNLPATSRVEGLRVRAVLDVLRDAAGTHQVGPIVEVVRIDVLGPGGTSPGAG